MKTIGFDKSALMGLRAVSCSGVLPVTILFTAQQKRNDI